MNSLTLKLFAMFTMLIDHSIYVFLPKNPLTLLLGRLAMPIFAYQISEGYIHTKNLKKYFIRLILFSIISQFPFMFFLKSINLNPLTLNVMYTLLFGLLAILVYDKIPKKRYSIPLIVLICLFAILLNTDYNAYGVLIILFFYIFRNSKVKLSLSFILLTIGYFALRIYPNLSYFVTNTNYLFLCIYTIFGLGPILLYNHKSGPNYKILKYSLYFFYPIHLLILALIK